MLIRNKGGIGVVNCELGVLHGRMKCRLLGQDQMPKWGAGGRIACADAKANLAALHEDNRMVTILSRWRCGQPKNVLRFDLPHDLLEAECGEVVALVHNDMTIVRYKVLDLALVLQTLEQRHIDNPCPGILSARDLADRLCREIKK